VDYVAGYTVVNDVSGRDAQFDDGQFFRGKSYDTFAPMGPARSSPTNIDPGNLDVECRVDGETKQPPTLRSSSSASRTSSSTSAGSRRSGRVTSSPPGRPAASASSVTRPELLEPGDTVEVEVEGIGTLTNPVVAERE